jgi:UDP-N-acetylmuramate dehydrogenase
VNVDEARAADVCALIELARDTVERETGHRLETEIDFIGEFAPPTDAAPTKVPKDPDLVTAAERAQAS